MNALCGDHVCLSMYNLVSANKPCHIFMKFGIGVLYKKLSGKCGFCENQLTDVHTKGINVLLPAHSIGVDGFR